MTDRVREAAERMHETAVGLGLTERERICAALEAEAINERSMAEERRLNVRERRRLYLHNPEAAGPLCATCAHYHAHYILDALAREEPHFLKVHSGHCSCPRGKLRYAYDTCEHWTAKVGEKHGE